MLTLKYNDLVYCDTFTFKTFAKQQREIELAEAKLERMDTFYMDSLDDYSSIGEIHVKFD